MAIAFDNNLNLFTFLKLSINSFYFDCRFQAIDRAHDLNLAFHALVINIFDNQPHVLVDAIVRTDVAIELVKPTESLCQVSTGFLYHAIFINFSLKSHWYFGPNDKGQIVGLFSPLGHKHGVVISRLKLRLN